MSKNLFQLIKKLSPNEKGYFKKVSRIHSLNGKDTAYIRLFDILDKQEQYDKKEVDAYFGNKKIIGQLPVISNYLYYLILDTLEEFNSGKSTESRLKKSIANAEQLYIKGLYEQARTLIDKAKEKAEQSENFLLILQIYAFEGKLSLLEQNIGNLKKFGDALNESRKQVIEKFKNYSDYRQLVSQMFYISKSTGRHLKTEKDQAAFEKIMQHPLLSNRKQAQSISALYNYLLIHSYYHDIKKERDITTSIKFNMERLQLLEANRQYASHSPVLYISVLHNLLLNAGEIFDLDLFKFLLEKVKNANEFLEIKPEPEVESFRNLTFIKYNIFQSFISGDFQQGIDFIKGNEQTYYELHQNRGEEETLVFCLNLFHLYFGVGDFKQALNWVNKFIQTEQQTLRLDLWINVNWVNILIQVELENFEFATSLIRSFIRFLNKHPKEFAFENQFVKVLRSYIEYALNDKETERFTKMKEMKKLLNENNQVGVISDVDYTLLVPWVKSKVEGHTFTEMYKKCIKDFKKRVNV